MNDEKKSLLKEEAAAENERLNEERLKLEAENAELTRQILSSVRHVYGFSPVSLVVFALYMVLSSVGKLLGDFVIARQSVYDDIPSVVLLAIAIVVLLASMILSAVILCYAFFSTGIVNRMIGAQCIGFGTCGLFISDLMVGNAVSNWPGWLTVLWVLMGIIILVRARFTEKNLDSYTERMAAVAQCKQKIIGFFKIRG